MTLELDELKVCCDSRYDFDVLFAVEDVVDQFVEDNFLLRADNINVRDTLRGQDILSKSNRTRNAQALLFSAFFFFFWINPADKQSNQH